MRNINLVTLLVCFSITACGGGGGNTSDDATGEQVNVTPLPTLSPTPEVTPVVTVMPSPTTTPNPTAIPIPTATAQPTAPPVPTPSPEPTATATPVTTPTVTPTPTSTPLPTLEPTPEPTPIPLRITSGNALELTSAVATSSLKTNVPISTEFAGILTAIAPKNSPGLDHNNLLKGFVSNTGTNIEKASFPSTPLNCDISGTLAYTGNINNTDQFSPGDSIALTFDQCSNQSNIVINGLLTYSVAEFNGEISINGTYHLAYLMTFDIQYQNGDTSASIIGNVATEITEDLARHSTTLRALSLAMVIDGNERVIEDYIYIQNLDKDASTVAFTASGSITSDELGGTIEFNTIDPLTISAGLQNPLSGEFTIRDLQGASATLNVLTGGFVQIHIDEDGDENTDEVQLDTWSNVENFFD